jgi:hypothetical protein
MGSGILYPGLLQDCSIDLLPLLHKENDIAPPATTDVSFLNIVWPLRFIVGDEVICEFTRDELIAALRHFKEITDDTG